MVCDFFIPILSSIFTILFFLFLIIRMSQRMNIRKFIGLILAVSSLIGFCMYFYVYSNYSCIDAKYNNLIQLLLHAVYSTIKMFFANDDLTSYVDTNVMPTQFLTGFWVIHILAISSTLLLIVTTYGKQLVQKLYLLTSRKKKIIICKVNQKSLALAENIVANRENADHDRFDVIFLDTAVCENDRQKIDKIRAFLVEKAPIAADGINQKAFFEAGLKGKGSLLIKFKNRFKTWFYDDVDIFSFYEDDYIQYNLYASLREHANKCKFPIEKLRFFFHVEERSIEDKMSVLYRKEKCDTYRLSIFSTVQLAAEQLWVHNPLSERYKDDFYAGILFDEPEITQNRILIVGFGGLGQAVLRNAMHFGQFLTYDWQNGFIPTKLHVDVIDENIELRSEAFHRDCPSILDHPHLFDIEYISIHVESTEFRSFMDKNSFKYSHIIVTVGDDTQNIHIALEIDRINKYKSSVTPNILINVKDKIRECRLFDAFLVEEHIRPFGFYEDIFDYDLITNDQLDKSAKFVHDTYCVSNHEIRNGEKWELQDHFTRESNRMQLKFWDINLPYMNLASNEECKLRYEIKKEHLESIIPTILEIMAINEHYRWNAFHFINGWRTGYSERYGTLPWNETKLRWEITNGDNKDKNTKLHSCLVEWYELETLDSKKIEDFHKYDRINSFSQLIRYFNKQVDEGVTILELTNDGEDNFTNDIIKSIEKNPFTNVKWTTHNIQESVAVIKDMKETKAELIENLVQHRNIATSFEMVDFLNKGLMYLQNEIQFYDRILESFDGGKVIQVQSS